jgi:hypothetical protein
MTVSDFTLAKITSAAVQRALHRQIAIYSAQTVRRWNRTQPRSATPREPKLTTSVFALSEAFPDSWTVNPRVGAGTIGSERRRRTNAECTQREFDDQFGALLLRSVFSSVPQTFLSSPKISSSVGWQQRFSVSIESVCMYSIDGLMKSAHCTRRD